MQGRAFSSRAGHGGARSWWGRRGVLCVAWAWFCGASKLCPVDGACIVHTPKNKHTPPWHARPCIQRQGRSLGCLVVVGAALGAVRGVGMVLWCRLLFHPPIWYNNSRRKQAAGRRRHILSRGSALHQNVHLVSLVQLQYKLHPGAPAASLRRGEGPAGSDLRLSAGVPRGGDFSREVLYERF